jgi:hypothetical protein
MLYDTIEIRKVNNGVVVTIRSDDEDQEYVYDRDSKAIKFVKELLENKGRVATTESRK